MQKLKTSARLIFLATMLSGCGNSVQFAPDVLSKIGKDGQVKGGESFIPLQTSTAYFAQNQYDRNETTVVLQAFDNRGFSVKDLRKEDFDVIENGTGVENFKVSGDDKDLGRHVDIIFVLDITGSMQPYIDQVKAKVTQFVRNLQTQNVKANLCLVTFNDDVQDACDSFVEDDPDTKKKNENLDDFLDKVGKLTAFGGGDTPENQLLALETASQSPWHAGSQRMAILLTDAPFHYAPGHEGDAGDKAPTYAHTLQMVVGSQMQIFAVAPDEHGYRDSFQGMPSLTEATYGTYYNFNSITRGNGDLSKIFDAIVDQVSTTYSLNYVIEENKGLDGTKDLAHRRIEIRDSNGARKLRVKVSTVSSSQPNGHPEYQRRFLLQGSARPEMLSALINGVAQPAGYHVVSDGVEFEEAPPAKADIRVFYLKRKIRDNMQVPKILVEFPKHSGFPFQVTINGKGVAEPDFTVVAVDASHSEISFGDAVFADADPYQIIANQGMRLKVSVDSH